MKVSILIITFILMFGQKASAQNSSTEFFPKKEVLVDTLPAAHNLWVFLMAGQSNMAGRGKVEPNDTLTNPRIFSINKEGNIILAKEPIHFYEPNLSGLDSGHAFGAYLVNHLPDSVSVMIIPTAVGASSIDQWLNDSMHRGVSLLSNFREKVKIGSKYGTIKGVLWHQGEKDANQGRVSEYDEKLERLITEFRTITANEHLPVLIGELGSYSKNENWGLINQQIYKVESTDSLVQVIKTKDLKHLGDFLHFDNSSQREMGVRFARTYLSNFTDFYK